MDLLDKIDYSKPDEILVTQQNTLRKLIGILGILLPIALYVFLRIDIGYAKPLESISHYYFTRVSGIFVITVSLLAIFLIIYKGKDPIDSILSTIAGLAALLLILFPTSNIDPKADWFVCSVTTLKESPFRITFHYIASAIFLLSLAFMAMFVFTKSDKPEPLRTRQKKIRNAVYRICAMVMFAALITAFIGHISGKTDFPMVGTSLTFWMETIAVISFGFSWLVKAEVFFKDKPEHTGQAINKS